MSKTELKAKRYIELPIPVDERVPEGHKLILAYTDGVEVIAPLDPCTLADEDDHNCDWEGCSSLSHVFRCSPEQKYMLERGDSNRRCEPERTTDWYLDRLPDDVELRKIHKTYYETYQPLRGIVPDAHGGKTPTEALKKLWDWCIAEGHVTEEKK